MDDHDETVNSDPEEKRHNPKSRPWFLLTWMSLQLSRTILAVPLGVLSGASREAGPKAGALLTLA